MVLEPTCSSTTFAARPFTSMNGVLCRFGTRVVAIASKQGSSRNSHVLIFCPYKLRSLYPAFPHSHAFRYKNLNRLGFNFFIQTVLPFPFPLPFPRKLLIAGSRWHLRGYFPTHGLTLILFGEQSHHGMAPPATRAQKHNAPFRKVDNFSRESPGKRTEVSPQTIATIATPTSGQITNYSLCHQPPRPRIRIRT